MNTKIYKAVHALSTKLLTAAEKDDDATFIKLFAELKALCYDNQNDKVKNHPVQWETLADFCEDIDEAISYYKIALGYATDINDKDYTSSINYTMATLYKDIGDKKQALVCANEAKIQANKIPDKELKEEIESLITSLT